MRSYAVSSGNDAAQFTKRLLASINKMVNWSILLTTDTDERWEISTVLGLILTAEDIGGIEAEYARLRDQPGAQAAEEDAPSEEKA